MSVQHSPTMNMRIISRQPDQSVATNASIPLARIYADARSTITCARISEHANKTFANIWMTFRPINQNARTIALTRKMVTIANVRRAWNWMRIWKHVLRHHLIHVWLRASDAYLESASIMITVRSVASVQMVLQNTIKGNKNSALKLELIIEKKRQKPKKKIKMKNLFADVLTMMSVPLERINAHTSAKISMVHTCVSAPMIWCWPMINIHAFPPIFVQPTTVAAPTFVM